MMLLTGKWNKPGVYTVEEFDPDPYLDAPEPVGPALADRRAPRPGGLRWRS